MKNFWTLTRKGRFVGLALLTATAFSACGEDGQNGGDGAASLIETSDASAEECATGGSVITTGLDTNGDGELSEDEVVSSTIICNGVAGAAGEQGEVGPTGPDGADGANGADGADGSVQIVTEDPGDNCADGGLAFVSSVGDDATTSYFCNQNCEPGDYVGIEVGEGDAGEVVYNGFDTVTFPVTADQTGFAVSTIYSTPGFEFDLSYDDAEGLMVSPTSGVGSLEVAVAFSDGCGYFADTVRIDNVQFGESFVYIANFYSGAEEVDVVATGPEAGEIGTTAFGDVLGPFFVDSDTYTFDFLVDDASIGMTPGFTFAPERAYVVYAYDNAGELAFDVREREENSELEDEYELRVTHLVDGTDDVTVAFVAPESAEILDTALSFSESTELFVRGDLSSYLAVDTDADGNPEFNFYGVFGRLGYGLAYEAFLINDDAGAYLVLIDLVTGVVSFIEANINERIFIDFPETFIDGNSEGSTSITVQSCNTVDDISLYLRTATDDEVPGLSAWGQEMTVTLESPGGLELTIWDQEAIGLAPFNGSFNGDYVPSPGVASLMSDFIGESGTGEWILTIVTNLQFATIIKEVGLTLTCS